MTEATSNEGTPSVPMADELFAVLGRVVFHFAGMEQGLRDAIRTALGFSDSCDILLTGLSFTHLLDRFSLLYAPLQAPDLVPTGMRAFCSDLTKLNEERNRQVHSTWGFWGSGVPSRMRKRLHRNEGVSFTMESVRPEELLHLAQRLEHATDLIYELQIRLLNDHALKRMYRIG